MLTRTGAIVLGVVAVLASAGAYCAGRRAVHHATARTTIANEVAVAQARHDTTKAVAQRALVHTDSQRVITRRAEVPVHIASDSSIAIPQGAVLDTTPVPLPVVTELREDRAQIGQDSITVRAQVARADASDSLLTLTRVQATQDAHAALWRGLKIGAAVGGAIVLLLHVLAR